MNEKQLPNTIDALPLFIPIEMVGNLLNIKRTALYCLAGDEDFTATKIGKKYVIMKDDFIDWYKNNLLQTKKKTSISKEV